MSSSNPQPSHIPDYQKLCRLTKKIPTLDPEQVITMILLRSVADEITAQLQESLDRYGISEGRLRILGHLLDREEPATHSELAAASNVTKGTVTGLIDGLEQDGLVKRSASERDRRVSHIELTSEGEKALNRILPGHTKRLSEIMGVLSKAEQRTLMKILDKFWYGLSPEHPTCPPTGDAS